MKVVVLALTLLLALGSQARSFLSDAPSDVEHYKAAAMVYLNQVKDHAYKALEQLDGSEYEQYKQKLTESLERLQEYGNTASQHLSPLTSQVMAGTEQVRQHILSELQDLHAKVDPHRAELRQVIEKHVEEYREKLVPLVQKYIKENQLELDALRPKLDEVRTLLETNFEETKSKLEPIVEAVRTKLTKQLEDLRSLAAPYAAEYKEHLLKSVEDMKDKLAPHTANLQGQVEPYLETVKARLVSLYESVAEALQA